jgi:hypothetical protein
MKKINIYILGILLTLFSSCETDVEMIQIQEGIPSVVESNIDQGTLIKIIEENDQNVIYSLEWTYADYLGENETSSSISEYIIKVASSEDFSNAVTVNPTVYLTHGFQGIELNDILVNQLEVMPEEPIEIFFKVESTFDGDVLNSNIISNTFIPYTFVIPPAVWLPPGDKIYIFGAAVVGDTWPIPATQKLTKISETEFSINVDLIGGMSFGLQANGWEQAYNLPADVVREDVTIAGAFVEDGNNAHDELGNLGVERWEGQEWLSPSEDGVYTITLNFQTGLYTVEPAPPVVYLPTSDVIYIAGDAIGWAVDDKYLLTKVSDTEYTVTADLLGNNTYVFLVDGAWDQIYQIPGDVTAGDVTLAGSFREDGNKAHDADGNEASIWLGQGFLTPAEDATYTVTLDFMRGTYTVVKQ